MTHCGILDRITAATAGDFTWGRARKLRRTTSKPTHFSLILSVADPEGMPASPFVSTLKGIPMRNCTERERLVKEWHEAVLKFSKAVSRLNACSGDNRNSF